MTTPMTITSEQARAMIPDYTQHDICVELRRRGMDSGQLAEKTMWLVYLCSKGDIYSVKDFIQSTDTDELRTILNNKLFENWDGTVLHTVLYWNTGNKAVDLFELLVEHGADPVRDYYGLFPWENNAPLWILPLGSGQIGDRDMGEFEETYQYLRNIYDPSLNTNVNENAVPVAQDDDITIIVNHLNNTHIVARSLNFDFVCDKSSIDNKVIDLDDEMMDEKDNIDYSDMPALVDSDDDDEYADMPPLEQVGDVDYSDMPELVNESDDETEYADMPALTGVRLVYSDDEEFYD
jgi:hypothetical protein